MNYDLSKVGTRKQSPYISYGSGQTLKINQIELVKSQSTDSVKAVLHMETEPIKDANFEPIDGAKGRVGKVGCGVYMKYEKQKEEFLQKMTAISDALGLKDEVSRISGDSFETVVREIEKVITGNKYAVYTVFGEEYAKSNGTIGLRLMLPRWNFVQPVDAKESTNIEFDVNNPQHLKKISKNETSSAFGTNRSTIADEVDDLPF